LSKYRKLTIRNVHPTTEKKILKEGSHIKWLYHERIEPLAWTIGKISHSLIRIEDTESVENRINRKLLKSKILSGGLQRRFLSNLSENTKNVIKIMIEYEKDKHLFSDLTNPTPCEMHKYMMSIIGKERNENVELFIKFLQWNLLKRNPMAKAGGEEGLMATRCAFAVNLSLNRKDNAFSEDNLGLILCNFEIHFENSDGESKIEDEFSHILVELKSLSNIEPIIQCWEASSKIRIWLQEKRRDISNNLQLQIDTNQLQEVSTKEPISYDSQQEDEEDKKKYLEEDEELITIPPKKNSEKPPHALVSVQKSDLSQGMSKEEIMDSEREKVQEIISGLIQKAEFMIKLETTESLKLFENDRIDNSLSINSILSSNNMKKSVSVRKFESIREKQISQEISKSLKNMESKEIFASCSSLVLAILQSSLTAQEIQTIVERRYVYWIRRYLGFKMLNNLFKAYSPDKNWYLLNLRWLKHALKQNYDELCHYSDGITAWGEFMIVKCQNAFFEIYNSMVECLTKATTEDMEFVTYSLTLFDWKILGRDHSNILKSGILEFLQNGNFKEEQENIIAQA
jgi:hypothetical protein